MDRVTNWEATIEAWLEYMLPKKTWKDYLSDIPFYFAYWFSYPFVWLAYWLWQGIMQVKDEVWD